MVANEARACFLQVGRQSLEVVAAAERIDHVDDAGFVGDDLLRPQGERGRRLGRERQRFVERIRVQRLSAAENRRRAPGAPCAPRCCRAAAR